MSKEPVPRRSIPLMQGFLFSVLEGDVDGTNVYAKALFPQMSKCRPSTFKRLKRNLLDEGVTLDDTTTQEIMEDLQDAYSCFGYTCRSIGNYQNGPDLDCGQDNYNPPLAGYAPLTDVSAVSFCDVCFW